MKHRVVWPGPKTDIHLYAISRWPTMVGPEENFKFSIPRCLKTLIRDHIFHVEFRNKELFCNH